jgi:hypothetical protein
LGICGLYAIMDALYVRMHSRCVIIIFIFNNLAVTGNTNMLVIGNEYTSDGQHKYACHWYRITSDRRRLPVTSNLLPVTVYQ